MSYSDGLAAINLEMPKRIPRTEYSADTNWELVSSVTGTDVNAGSDDSVKAKARLDFLKTWNYDLYWNILIHGNVFGSVCTKMGHAVYASGDVDFDRTQYCPFKDTEEVLHFDPWQAFGHIDIKGVALEFEEHYAANCRENPDGINMTGIYVTCVSGLIEIFGWDMLLLSLGTDPVRFGELTNRYCAWIKQYFDALALANVPVAMVHDDIVWTSGAFTSPRWYRKYVFPNYKRLFSPLVESGKKLLYTSDGNYTEFIDDIADCGVHGFVLEPTTDLQYIANKYGKTHVIIGNVDTRALMCGTKNDIYREVKRCIDIGRDCPGYFMAVGNHIPSNTPVENAIYYNDIYEKLGKR